ncbi:hypothetical protein GCM10020000_55420 [Streptomyces olivoverticillatus]
MHILRLMTVAGEPNLIVGEQDSELTGRLERELDAFNEAATGAAPHGDVSVKVTDADGRLVGGLTAWVWGGGSAVSSCSGCGRTAVRAAGVRS